MMAPYAVGHLKMSFFLEELGYKLKPNERVKFYLTNTLETEELEQSRLPGFSALAEESRLAGKVKKETPILVILGNPPYSVRASNQGSWIAKLVDNYKYVDGKPLGERRIGVIQDDYVRFIRFAEWKIAQSGEGVIGMITNHSYLDNPTFRGMRQHLMNTFDEIYVLDLHGNSLKKERCPDGSKDENVFDIQQGVAIAFFVKRGDKRQGPVRVCHAELWGRRGEKYAWLHTHSFNTTSWQEVKPSADFYFFLPRDDKALDKYKEFLSVQAIFPVHGVGIITRKDKLTIRWSEKDIWTMVLNFCRLDPELARAAYNLGKDTTNWKVAQAQQDISSTGPRRQNIAPILYRPFDTRYTYYTGRSSGFHSRPCRELMRHMLAGENVALLVKRQGKRHPYSYVFVANLICESCVFESAYANNSVLPLYLYPSADRNQLFSHHELTERQPNLNLELVTALAKVHETEPSPEDVFHYIYAVLYSPSYREKYAQFLRTDFPRVPFTKDRELFEELAAFGKRLVDLHLLHSDELDPPIARFEGDGDGIVKTGKNSLRYDPKTERVYINKFQYFKGIPPQVWEYQIGGYQVCHKWLKDRKDRHLSLDEIKTYCRIVTALSKTIEIQEEIDKLYPAVEESLLPIQLDK